MEGVWQHGVQWAIISNTILPYSALVENETKESKQNNNWFVSLSPGPKGTIVRSIFTLTRSCPSSALSPSTTPDDDVVCYDTPLVLVRSDHLHSFLILLSHPFHLCPQQFDLSFWGRWIRMGVFGTVLIPNSGWGAISPRNHRLGCKGRWK